MKQLTIKIARGADDFGAWIEEVPGVYSAGDSVREIKENVMEALSIFIEENNELPEILKGKYQVAYHFDTESLLQYYKGIFTNAGIEKITGISQKIISHYANGLKKPRTGQRKRIESAFHKLGEELISIEL